MRVWISSVVMALACGSALGGTSGAAEWKPVEGQLMTRWAKDVSPDHALAEYPRPQMTRARWLNLNGPWDYALADAAVETAPAAERYAGQILVPFAMESALSGVKHPAAPGQRLWYRRTFTVPADWAGQRVKLHFGAVNWQCAAWVNGKPVGTHRGGYDGFTFDVTAALRKGGENELVVSAWNPLRVDSPDAQVLGKQRLKPGGIFYTAATGIWQTVWLEPVPTVAAIESLKLTPDLDGGVLRVTVVTDPPGADATVRVVALDGGREVGAVNGAVTGPANAELTLAVPNPHPWTPDDPHLYDLKVTLLSGDKTAVDGVDAYFAMRKVSLAKDDKGRTRVMLNNRFVFQVGALDQGYWPDGLYTAPTDEALRYDVDAAKRLGFNLLRKHAKVEPPRWYYWTDKLGMLVWQDMPQMFGPKDGALSDDTKAQFDAEWQRIVTEFYNVPSIVVWTTFNEGWGQHDTPRIVDMTHRLDPTRLVNNASGWTDAKVGDLDDVHAYPGPGTNEPTDARAAVNGEFGGLGMRVEGHMWAQGSWGYQGVYAEPWRLTRHYQKLLKAAYDLVERRGLSAVVYTQITDVEVESNGLLTYDRAVIKPDAEITLAANRGQFPPMPPNPHPDLVATSQEEPADWWYTTDKPADEWARPTFDASAWKAGPAPFGKGVPGVRTPWTTADVWLRREFDAPARVPDKLEFTIFHDEDAEVYVNGVLATSVKGFTTDYVTVPVDPAAVAAIRPGGKNTLAVHCHQTVGGQGIDVGITVPAKVAGK